MYLYCDVFIDTHRGGKKRRKNVQLLLGLINKYKRVKEYRGVL